MGMKKKHSVQNKDLSKKTMEMIEGIYIGWNKSSEQVWADLEKRMDSLQPIKTVSIAPRIRLAIAAAIALLAGIAVFMQLYTRNYRIPSGQHSQVILPDGSLVKMNAQSHLSCKPLLWMFSRTVKFEGEAYFEVKPGKKFEVVSGKGSTLVLGTRFNIYARYDDYQVTCVAGKVKVTAAGSPGEAILLPGQQAVLNPSGMLDVESGVNTEQSLSWLNNMLSFTSIRLTKVFEEISRQYNIHILLPEDLDSFYSGTFRRDTSVEQALDLVCKPFNLTFTRKAENEYIISRSK